MCLHASASSGLNGRMKAIFDRMCCVLCVSVFVCVCAFLARLETGNRK